ncbi:MAG: amidohydrolase family protein [Anaerolineae bacterium]|nr:amidohydrolase family protein [Anaerolineae bacterium]
MEARLRRVEAARGERAMDLLIEDVQLINVYTGEIYPSDIGISGEYVAYVGPPAWSGPEPKERFSAEGKFAAPGLIDSHIHIESSMMSPAGFAAAVLPRGTTTVVIDPHEIGNVLGLRGVRYMLEATADLPLRVFVQVPSCVPSVPTLETAGAEFGAAEVAEMLTWDRVIGLAEVMDYMGVILQSDRMRSILDVALAIGTVISGHCPGLRGRQLAAYMLGGPLSDHEGHDADELLEKLRLGMAVEGRVSSFSESMSVLGKIVQELGTLPPNLIMCTDDIFPEDLLRHGHLDNGVRHAISAGIPPVDAIRAATLNGAQRHRLHDLGAIAPGKRADILLLRNLQDFEVDEVFVGGVMVARAGRLAVDLPKVKLEIEQEDTIHLPHLPRREDFTLRARSGRQRERLHVMTIRSGERRGLVTIELPVRDGLVDFLDVDDVCLVAILERHGRTGNRSLNLVQGLGLRQGAVATTVAHDSHNLLVVGRSVDDMVIAANELAACGEGICCACDGKIMASLPLPIAGLMCPLPLEDLAPMMQKLNEALRNLGLTFHQPIGPILGLALPVIPDYSLTDMGLVDVERQVILPIWADED